MARKPMLPQWPATKSRWAPLRNPHFTVRVMAVVESYVVARYKGCVPFLVHVNKWAELYTEATP